MTVRLVRSLVLPAQQRDDTLCASVAACLAAVGLLPPQCKALAWVTCPEDLASLQPRGRMLLLAHYPRSEGERRAILSWLLALRVEGCCAAPILLISDEPWGVLVARHRLLAAGQGSHGAAHAPVSLPAVVELAARLEPLSEGNMDDLKGLVTSACQAARWPVQAILADYLGSGDTRSLSRLEEAISHMMSSSNERRHFRPPFAWAPEANVAGAAALCFEGVREGGWSLDDFGRRMNEVIEAFAKQSALE